MGGGFLRPGIVPGDAEQLGTDRGHRESQAGGNPLWGHCRGNKDSGVCYSSRPSQPGQ